MPVLSKSRYISGLQCAKRLWFEVNARDQVPAVDASTQAVFEQGHEVGRLAQQLFPGGIEIDRELRWEEAARLTAEALPARRPIYEAAFAHGGGACRADIVVPVGDGEWDLYEVKSSTKAKPEHREDMAFQTWVMKGAGLSLRRSHLVHLSSTYVRKGELDIARLLAVVDLTGELEEELRVVPANLERFMAVVRGAAPPPIPIGAYCKLPHRCPLIPHCWQGLPEQSVTTLYRGKGKIWELLARGVVELDQIPPEERLTRPQRIQVEAARRGEAVIDRRAVWMFLDRLVYPLHFLDFEAFALAIPLFDDARPFEQIPFQYSLQVVAAPGAAPEEHAFLAEGNGDPREGLLAALRERIGPAGSLVAFNAPFEAGCLRTSAAAVPAFSSWVAGLLPRFVDLLLPFQSFAYYHPRQQGSASLKDVLPILGKEGYDGLEIQEGSAAAQEYLRSLDPALAPTERARIRAALLAYCGRDTEGMVEIVAALERLVNP